MNTTTTITRVEDTHPEKLEPAFRFSRYGKYNSPNPMITGRHESNLNLQESSGFDFYEEGQVGKDKPHAFILSRKYLHSVATNPPFQNIFGWTRFGKAWSPSVILRSRPVVKDNSLPGPGTYEHDICEECRILISLKRRWVNFEWDNGYDSPGPNEYNLPSFIGKGPSYTLSSKYPEISTTFSSPGPIYTVPPERKKGKSLTFKPFPLNDTVSDPGPAHYNIIEASKRSLRSFPSVKFAKEFCDVCEWPQETLISVGPGPGAYKLEGRGPNPPIALMTSRPKTKYVSCGSGKFVDLFGLTRFGRCKRSNAIIVSRHYPKVKKREEKPKPDDYTGFNNFASKKIGITIKSRLKGLELTTASYPGPGHYQLRGLIGQGPAFSLGPKQLGHMKVSPPPMISYNTTDISECSPPLDESVGIKPCIETDQSQRVGIRNPQSNDIFDHIPYLENLCINY